jgi:predicted HD phosphohydrolase
MCATREAPNIIGDSRRFSAPSLPGDFMEITLSQHCVASRLAPALLDDAPLASFEALARQLRAAARANRFLWRRSVHVAVIARRAGACDALITAAWMHCLGDLVPPPSSAGAPPSSAAAIAHFCADLLVDLYPPLVTETIRMHPSALRYVKPTLALPRGTARDESGCAGLDAVSMTECERACFAALPFAMNALRLARWSLAAEVEANELLGFERELPALYRIAERTVCNDGFGWAG